MTASQQPILAASGMTFVEIAAHEGISVSGVFFAYRSGMRKLRRHKEAFATLTALAGELQRNRHADHAVSRKVVKL